MVQYNTFQLNNGLRVVVHEDPTTPLAAVNILYDVGSRDEKADKTGFAHLFEHLMFEGSVNIPNFDTALYRAGGESNAFTGNDITNYYDVTPANNVETVFWLESDRMLGLDFNEKSLRLQKDIVSEEFKESCLNQPYGDAWHQLRGLSYQQHPYKWPVIGKELAHIQKITLVDVRSFYRQHYCPNRAVMAIAGGVKTANIERLAKKWFGDIKAGQSYQRQLPMEPKQKEFRSLTVEAKVPCDAIYMAFHTCSRYSSKHYTTDLMNELLSGGHSSRLYQALVKEQALFNSLDTYLTGSFDAGLLMVYGLLNDGVSLEQAENAIWQELDKLKNGHIDALELAKTKNAVESAIAFSEIDAGSKAFNLAYFELMGDVEEINSEISKYLHITIAEIQEVAKQIFCKTNCSVVYYKKKII